ncbi:MAG: putative Ig domain-containing protein, partial [Nitrospirota bacterium]|nr:putative Ig domain-containing protein [Nitrospirota bacterium]
PAEISGSLTVRTIEFSDGTRMHVTDLLGTEGDDIIITGSGDDSINGRGGNDVITTGEGSDILIGGIGNDILTGGIHNDTYIFNVGDGLDTINDTAAPGEGNRIVFGPGIAPIDITLTFENTTLKINVGSNGDGILLGNFDPNDAASAKVIETFEFENFTEISFADFIERYGIHITGTDGDDIISGTNVNDTISGLAGNDVINGGAGPNIMIGGLGNDSYFIENADDKVIESLNEGDDTVIASISHSLPENVENLVLAGSGAIDGTGNALNNSITGNSAANTLYGNEGDDNLSGNSGDDTIYGEDGADILSGGEGSDILTGGAGNDTYVFNIGDGVDTIADTSTLAEGNMILFGEGITSSDLTFVRNDGSLTINIGNSGDAINLLNFDQNEVAGSLVVRALQFADGNQMNLADFLNRPPVVVTPIADQTTMEDAAFSFTVPGNTFADIDAGDTLTYSATLADGTALPSWLTFNAAMMTFSGTPTNDNVGILPLKVTATDAAGASVSNNFNVTIENVNNDSVITYGTNGIDFIITGRDNDLIYALDGIDAVYSGEGDDTIYGGNGSDLLLGDGGNDEIYGENGNDIIFGCNGNDILNGGTGSDAMFGGTGNDIYYVDKTGDVVMENANNGTDTVNSSITYALGNNVENLTLTGTSAINGKGNTLNNVLTGNNGINTLAGNNGNDSLKGHGGNDILTGGNGGDSYLFSRTDGKDTVTETAGLTGDTDIVKMIDGISTTEPVIVKQNNDLYLFVDADNYMKVTGQFQSANYGVERLEVTDGHYITRQD